eukprot:TRINITY_DN369_c0_g1_i1.p1 TRINITY_DN369_c0_g1~~TRINITY_DN369_c0_g1_i1.p1  ORF type:complete len:732 (+),score=191.00 TRINITY_DN369_c0_g1_i1:122-2317(+)
MPPSSTMLLRGGGLAFFARTGVPLSVPRLGGSPILLRAPSVTTRKPARLCGLPVSSFAPRTIATTVAPTTTTTTTTTTRTTWHPVATDQLVRRYAASSRRFGAGLAKKTAWINSQKLKKQQKRTADRRLNLKELDMPASLTAKGLSSLMGVRVVDVLKLLIRLGENPRSANDMVPPELADMIAVEFFFIPKRSDETFNSKYDLQRSKVDPAMKSTYPLRPPVVTVMGHVDHGKTTLLDTLRQTSMANKEAGGITQQIGAFSATFPGGHDKVTFIDTPGHEAFSLMRERGSQLTDIVVLVVAADDGVKPQTVEAIKHIKEANVPIVVAVNKCDKHGVDLLRVPNELLAYDITAEQFGGDVPLVSLSALTGKNVDKLVETLSLSAGMMDLRVPDTGPAEGTVVEVKIEKGKGTTATILVRSGAFKTGDVCVGGQAWSKVRSLVDSTGTTLKTGGPSTPIELSGFRGMLMPGDDVFVVESESFAREVIDYREKRAAVSSEAAPVHVDPQEEALSPVSAGAAPSRELVITIKADTGGSLEAIQSFIDTLPSDEVSIRLVHSGLGTVNDSDVAKCIDSGASLYVFNVRTPPRLVDKATTAGVHVAQHKVIYHLVDEIKQNLVKALPPIYEKIISGEAEVLQLFPISEPNKKESIVAGCRVSTGTAARRSKVKVQVIRNGEVLRESRSLESLNHFKDDVIEVKAGKECGLRIRGFDELVAGDLVQFYEEKLVERTLD